jgi:hypothetical protein
MFFNRVFGRENNGLLEFCIHPRSVYSKRYGNLREIYAKDEAYLLADLQDIIAVLHSKIYYNNFAEHLNISRRCGSYGRLIFKNLGQNGYRDILNEHRLR